MAFTAATSPLCTWLIAACVTNSVAGLTGNDAPVSSGPLGRRLKRRIARSKQLTAESWLGIGVQAASRSGQSLVAFCESGLSELGTFCSLQGFKECNNLKQESLFGDGFFGESLRGLRGLRGSGSKSIRAGRRAVAAGKASAVVVQPAKESEQKKNKKTATKQRRVVVTGMGLVSCHGHDPDTFYENLLTGKSGITEIERFDCRDFPTRFAGEIKSFSTEGWVAGKFARRMDRFMLYLLTAGKKAVMDADISEEVMKDLDKSKCGVLIGSAMGGMQVFNDAIEALRVSYRKMNPFCVPFATTNMGSAMLAMDLGWMGPNYSISTACATSNFCMLSAANHIIRGEADVMLSGGSDAAIIPIGLGGFVACRALSQRNDDPAKASRPWDKNRDGFVMGEGAGVLLLEELEHAKTRGAEIYAEFLGGSFTCDAYHMTEPHPEGAGVLLCIEKALAQSGVNKTDVNYVNAHATSTKAGDLQEYKALMKAFGGNPELKVNSTKSMVGHLLGAAGAVEAIATIQAIRSGWVHPTINLEDPESEVDMNVIVGDEKQRLDIKVALSNSFGFGGHNSSILFAPYVEANEEE
ncbi:3-oxoacyl-[acyl-carrier-protein] synthase II, chloroplastic isoform X1 [Physcomitrium patens]|uniref:beta-ketoacyl-[acyl-carrier-protein] synthase I n=1 Tax=Physcomitrium patens TaxID=3218 RepID=A0A7I4D494_PHYPA|nr:3-oxoacyl-[acyl-carrier-protein] synthase II, chloroplastic-like isoform X1 [Physcomitrium patens]XP_024366459.1 3-oxoacyl-[acyl-carrier-protein] synthase II, chloroplastic-like isoform X1 [Physcomitrium patens]XP_024366460.1 3-oxoacyl-[acyl-carrier-protein] synthase II, chloroplastic-like isoform X1 [Physcomitrium patens]|eukprot:XP_024366458.1 3-oxoacyl-[acyl-carrier-protein] synthase II, chloroplastic-like isoform X1 [Physcomitrella patens]